MDYGLWVVGYGLLVMGDEFYLPAPLHHEYSACNGPTNAGEHHDAALLLARWGDVNAAAPATESCCSHSGERKSAAAAAAVAAECAAPPPSLPLGIPTPVSIPIPRRFGEISAARSTSELNLTLLRCFFRGRSSSKAATAAAAGARGKKLDSLDTCLAPAPTPAPPAPLRFTM